MGKAIKKASHKIGKLVTWFLMLGIKFYRKFISPCFPPTCRFTPTCSSYALQALEKYGAFKGSWLTLKRICRCHPWNDGGVDEVP
jgi:putative membrane protein insertion efficiency factor